MGPLVEPEAEAKFSAWLDAAFGADLPEHRRGRAGYCEGVSP